MTYLVDANVVSEPTKPQPHPGALAWLRRYESELAVDPIVIGELRFGIVRLPRSKKRASLERWFDVGIRRLTCLPWELETGMRWAELLARLRDAKHRFPSCRRQSRESVHTTSVPARRPSMT